MKKIFILSIILFLLMTFTLTLDKKIDEANIVTENEIANYKKIVINNYSKFGWELTEEELNKSIQKYINSEISSAKSNAKGMELGEALRFSAIFSSLFGLVLFIITIFSSAHYGEINHHTKLHNLDTTWDYRRSIAKRISEFFDNFWSSK